MTLLRKASKLLAACAIAAAVPATAAESAATPPHAEPQGGVTVIASFSMQPYTYDTYRKALSMEAPMMKKNGVLLLHSYRVTIGEVDKYYDVWWAPDYDTAYKAFYNPTYTDPAFAKFLADTTGAVVSGKIEIVEDQKF